MNDKQISNLKLQQESLISKTDQIQREYKIEVQKLEEKLKDFANEERVTDIISYNMGDFKIQTKEDIQRQQERIDKKMDEVEAGFRKGVPATASSTVAAGFDEGKV